MALSWKAQMVGDLMQYYSEHKTDWIIHKSGGIEYKLLARASQVGISQGFEKYSDCLSQNLRSFTLDHGY